MKEVKDRIETEEDWEDFNNATNCFICGNKFEEGEKKLGPLPLYGTVERLRPRGLQSTI